MNQTKILSSSKFSKQQPTTKEDLISCIQGTAIAGSSRQTSAKSSRASSAEARTSEEPSFKKIYVVVENLKMAPHTLAIPNTSTNAEILNMFMAIANCPTNDSTTVLKLKDIDGCLYPIGKCIPQNSASKPYTLSAIKCSGVEIMDTTNVETKEKLDKLLKLSMNGNKNSSMEVLNEGCKITTISPIKAASVISAASAIKSELPDVNAFEDVKLPSFDIWKYDEFQMIAFLEFMYTDLGLVEEFKIDLTCLRKFLLVVRNNYNKNPFHNFKHAFCVSQMMYSILNSSGIVSKLGAIDKLILLTSCIGHDLDHPGYTNAYQVNAMTELATIYNDLSPLENHHAAVLFFILKQKETGFMSNIPETAFRTIRKGIIQCILSTDMAKHKDTMVAFESIVDNFNYADPEHCNKLLPMILKCSDISNEVRPTLVAEQWVDLLLEEFFAQSDAEKKQGLPFMPFMDRDKVTKPNAQIGFIQFVLLPLFELLAKVVPSLNENYIQHIRDSLVYYKKMQETPSST